MTSAAKNPRTGIRVSRARVAFGASRRVSSQEVTNRTPKLASASMHIFARIGLWTAAGEVAGRQDAEDRRRDDGPEEDGRGEGQGERRQVHRQDERVEPAVGL